MDNALKKLSIFAFLLSVNAVMAAETVTISDGRTVQLNDDHTWEYLESGAEDGDDMQEGYAILTVVRKKESPTGCRFGLRMQNDLGYRIKSLVPEFSAYTNGNILYQTIARDFYEIKPTNSLYRQIHFSGITCDKIDYLKVHGADRCTMGPYTKFSSNDGECLSRIKVEKSELVKITK